MKSDKKLKKHKNNLSRKKINLVNRKKQVKKKSNSRKNTKLRNKKNKSKKKRKMKGGAQQANCHDILQDMKIENEEQYLECFLNDIYKEYDLKKNKKNIKNLYIKFLQNQTLDIEIKKKVLEEIAKNKLRYSYRIRYNKIEIMFNNIREIPTTIYEFAVDEYPKIIEGYLKIINNFPFLVLKPISDKPDFKSLLLFDFDSIDIDDLVDKFFSLGYLRVQSRRVQSRRSAVNMSSKRISPGDIPILDKYNLGIEIEGCFDKSFTGDESDESDEDEELVYGGDEGDESIYKEVKGIDFKLEDDVSIVCPSPKISKELILEKQNKHDRYGASGYTLEDVGDSNPTPPETQKPLNQALGEIQENLDYKNPCEDYTCGLHYHISHKDIECNQYGLLFLIHLVELWINKYQDIFMKDSDLKYQKTIVDSLEDEEFKGTFQLYSKINFFYTETQKILLELKKKLKDFLENETPQNVKPQPQPVAGRRKLNLTDNQVTKEKFMRFIYFYLQEITKDFDGNRMQLTVVPDPKLIHLEFRGMYPIELASQTVKFKQLVMNLWKDAITETESFLKTPEAGAAAE